MLVGLAWHQRSGGFEVAFHRHTDGGGETAIVALGVLNQRFLHLGRHRDAARDLGARGLLTAGNS